MSEMDVRDRKIVKAYIRDELSLKQLGKIHALTKERIRQILNKRGTIIRPRGRPPGPIAADRAARQAEIYIPR